jgi:hypothetical protein
VEKDRGRLLRMLLERRVLILAEAKPRSAQEKGRFNFTRFSFRRCVRNIASCHFRLAAAPSSGRERQNESCSIATRRTCNIRHADVWRIPKRVESSVLVTPRLHSVTNQIALNQRWIGKGDP